MSQRRARRRGSTMAAAHGWQQVRGTLQTLAVGVDVELVNSAGRMAGECFGDRLRHSCRVHHGDDRVTLGCGSKVRAAFAVFEAFSFG